MATMSDLIDFLRSDVGMGIAKRALWTCTHIDFRLTSADGKNRSVLVVWGSRRLCFLDEAPAEDIVRLLDANSKAKGKVLVAMAIDKEQKKRPQPNKARP